MSSAMSNAQIIKNSDPIETGDYTTGLLNPEQGNEFIDLVYNVSKLKDKVTTFRFTAQEKEIDLQNLNTRIVYPKDEGIPTGQRARVLPSQVKLTPFDWMATVAITYPAMRRNIMRGNVVPYILEQAAKQIANNMESFCLHGNLIGPSVPESFLVGPSGSSVNRVKDPLHAKKDGWLKQADSAHIFDAEDEHDISLVTAQMLKLMPEQYKSDLSELNLVMASNMAYNYNFQLSQRISDLGDNRKILPINANSTALGVQLESLPLFTTRPVTVVDVTLNGTTPESLGYENIVASEVFVNKTTLNSTVAEAPYIDTTDYIIDEANGTIERSGSSSIGDGQTVKVTFNTPPQILLTDLSNLIIGMNTDNILIERFTDKEAQVHYFYISGSSDVKILNTDAMVKAINVKDQLEL